jgi:hypothetical protein
VRPNTIELMRPCVPLLGVCVLLAAGCHQHPLTDYRPLDKAGMWSGSMEQLKALNVSDLEVSQVVKVKQARVSDESCVALVSAAHAQKHPFTSADSVASLAGAGFSEQQILEIARADQLDTISGDAVTLRLMGLSDSAVQSLLHRHMQGIPTLSNAEIARLKNTGLTEKQILERVQSGMTDAQAEVEIAQRDRQRNKTGFVRVRGGNPR